MSLQMAWNPIVFVIALVASLVLVAALNKKMRAVWVVPALIVWFGFSWELPNWASILVNLAFGLAVVVVLWTAALRSGRTRFAKTPLAIASGVVVVALIASATNSTINWIDSNEGPVAGANVAGDENKAKAADSLNNEAATWVRLLYLNFKGTNEVPEEISGRNLPVDLSTVHYYNKETNKESKTAFGPDMGKTPEDVSTNLVERLYRDPALLATVARDLKLTSFKNSEQAKIISELENDADKRRALANEVLGWYANPDLELTIKKHEGGYSSDTMSGNGTTSDTTSSGESNVLVATDEKTGKVKNQRRLDCGFQDFKPVKPKPKPTPKKPKAKCVEIPNNGVYDCGAKNVRKSTQLQGNNKTGGGGKAPTQTDSQGPPAAGTPPAAYDPPPKPAPKKTPRPAPPPPSETEAPPPSEPETTCIPSPGKDNC